MKNLYKKIGVVALSGIVIAGGILSSEVIIYANNSDNSSVSSNSNKSGPISWEELGSYGNFVCPEFPEVPIEFIYNYNPKDVLVKGDDSGIDRLYEVLQNSNFLSVRVSGVPGAINESLSKLRCELDNPDVEKLKIPKVCFKNISMFNQFMKDVNEKKNIEIPEGFYRIMVGGFDGVFYYKPPKNPDMFDDDIINVYYIERGQNKYKYKILKYNLDGDFYYEYEYPMIFDSVGDFFNKVHPRVRDKYVAPMVIGISGRHSEHGGIHEGGIYSARIGKLVFLFQAL